MCGGRVRGGDREQGRERSDQRRLAHEENLLVDVVG
jgi:hypothetical protein